MDKTTKTKKVKRFTALTSKTMTIDKSDLKHKQVENLAEKARLSIQLELSDYDEKIERQAQALINYPTEENFRYLAQMIQNKKDTEEQLKYLKQATDYLDEEVEVEETYYKD